MVKICYGKDWSYGVGAGIVEPTGEVPPGSALQTWGKPWEDKNQPGRESGREMMW